MNFFNQDQVTERTRIGDNQHASTPQLVNWHLFASSSQFLFSFVLQLPRRLQQSRQFMVGNPMSAKRLKRKPFERGARWILTGRDHLRNQLIRDLHRDLHTRSVAPI